MVVWKARKKNWLVLIYNFLFDEILELFRLYKEFVV